MTTLADITALIQTYTREQVTPLEQENATLEADNTRLTTRIRELGTGRPRWPSHAGNLTREQRQQLTPGEYIPGPATTGLLPGTIISRMKLVTGYQTIETGDPITDTYFPDGITFRGRRELRNVLIGTRGDAKGSTAAVTGTTTDGLHGSILEDFEIAAESDNSYTSAIWAGNCILRRGNIHGGVDGIDFQYRATQPTLTEANWIHDTQRRTATSHPGTPGLASDGTTHNDGVQFHRGKNITMRGDYIDRHNNEAVLLKQEVSDQPIDRLENILLDRLFFGTGWASAINTSVARGNTLNTVRIVRPVFTPNPGRHYILRNPTTFQGIITEPLFLDSSPAPISRGA